MGRLIECVMCKRYKSRLHEAEARVKVLEKEHEEILSLVEIIMSRVLKRQGNLLRGGKL